MDLLKKPYKISLWDEENVYVIVDIEEGQEIDYSKRYEVTALPEDRKYQVLNEYIREKRLVQIGSNENNSPIRALDGKLTKQLNGSNTLTFYINYRYFDEETEEFKLNPFIDLLVAERKIKLFYDDTWYDFIIKQIDEDSTKASFNYTCKSVFINELSKTGYNIELDTELENNQGSIIELGDIILEGSDWSIDKENSEIIKQYEDESLYEYILPNKITAKILDNFSYGKTEYIKDQEIKIEAGQKIYIFYSSFINKEEKTQFLYVPNTSELIVDEDGYVINSPNWYFTFDESIFDKDLEISSKYFGKKLISKQITKYLTEIDKYCYLYTKMLSEEIPNEEDPTLPPTVNEHEEKFYAYSEIEYPTSINIQNLISNSSDFITTNGWTPLTAKDITLSDTVVDGKITSALVVEFSSKEEGLAETTILNSGIYDNRRLTNGFVLGEKYIFAINYTIEDKIENENLITTAKISGKKPGEDKEEVNFFSFIKVDENVTWRPESLENYTILEGTCLTNISYNSLLDYNFNFYLSGKGEIKIIDAKLFKKKLDKNEKVIVPDLEKELNSLIKTKYNFFKAKLIDEATIQKIHSVDDLEIYETLYLEDLPSSGYKPICSENFEKIRSITASKSNRFNLIQELCETFECWADFKIYHDEMGRVVYDYFLVDSNNLSPGRTYYKKISNDYSKYKDFNFVKISLDENVTDIEIYEKKYFKTITFKEFIGQENQAGFRYGINLNSIKRVVNSDQIVTKLIVETNNNEFAENGACTIQTSELNPTGESFLFNFEYYIKHNLIDRQSLNNDLYDINNGIGLYTKLKRLNAEAEEPIKEISEISPELDKAISRRNDWKAEITSSSEIYEEAIRDLILTGMDRETAENIKRQESNTTYVNNAIIKREKAKTAIENSTEELKGTNNIYNDLNMRYEELRLKLDEIQKQKNNIINEFNKKYARFIQEGTWSSEDYSDSEAYYLDAQKVSYTSAFPKITYTINVIELSQVEGYSSYYFDVGDKTYIEDTEFFGWNPLTGSPHKEEIIVSEVTFGLDDISKNTIKVQNYKTQFEDLFQRIAATTQSFQYAEGRYERAAAAINEDGTINSSLLQNSLESNALVLKNSQNNSVTWDSEGITVSNFLRANEKVRIVSGGIMLTTDGGKTWSTGITGNGINASVVTTGRLDADKIRIFNGGQPSFEWNADGINAYVKEKENIDFNKFVRFNQYGLFGYIGEGEQNFNDIEDVVNKANFSLTWKGLKIQTDEQTENVINVNNNFIVDGTGKVTAVTFSQNIAFEEGSIVQLNGTELVNCALTGNTVISKADIQDSSLTNTIFKGSIQFENETLEDLNQIITTQIESYNLTKEENNTIANNFILQDNITLSTSLQVQNNSNTITGVFGAAVLGVLNGIALAAPSTDLTALGNTPYVFVGENEVRITNNTYSIQVTSSNILINNTPIDDYISNIVNQIVGQ